MRTEQTTADPEAQRQGPSTKKTTEPFTEVTIALPQSYVSFIEQAYEGDRLEDKIVRVVKETVLADMDAYQPEDWARLLGPTLVSDYEEKKAGA